MDPLHLLFPIILSIALLFVLLSVYFRILLLHLICLS